MDSILPVMEIMARHKKSKKEKPYFPRLSTEEILSVLEVETRLKEINPGGVPAYGSQIPYNKMPLQLRLTIGMGCAIRHSLYGNKQGRHWETLVGYTVDDLIKHLQKQFTDGMSWNNYGKWHIDHIIPVSAFSFTSPDDMDFKRCWALKNLQPLWAKDNISKGAQILSSFQSSLKNI